MRDVAARADVAMGTVYRYFTSKDHLLAATLVNWVELLDTRISQHPPRGFHPADRVLDVLDRALRAMGRQPKLVAAVFTSLSSPDPAAVGCQQQITLLMEGIIARAMGEFDIPDMADRARMIGHVWYSALVGWINGWSTMVRVYDELAVSVRLLLPEELVERRDARFLTRPPRNPEGQALASRPDDGRHALPHRTADRVQRHHQELRHRPGGRSPDASPCSRAGSPASSVRTARARRRPCACCSVWCTPRPAPPPSAAGTTRRSRTRRRPSAPCWRRPASIRHGGPARTCAWPPGPVGTTTSGPTKCWIWSGLSGGRQAEGRRLLHGHAPTARAGHRPHRRSAGAHPRRAVERARPSGHRLAARLHALPGRRGPHRARVLPPALRDGPDHRRRHHRVVRPAQGAGHAGGDHGGNDRARHARPHARGRSARPGPHARPASPSADSAATRWRWTACEPEQVGPLLASNQIVLYELLQEGGDLESVFLSLTTGLGFGEVAGQP